VRVRWLGAVPLDPFGVTFVLRSNVVGYLLQITSPNSAQCHVTNLSHLNIKSIPPLNLPNIKIPNHLHNGFLQLFLPINPHPHRPPQQSILRIRT
jgi:hypothetical protein